MPATAGRYERHYFEQFRKHYSLPAAEIQYGDRPDVLLVGERTTGVEIVRLFIRDGADKSSEQVQSVRRKEVVKRAQAKFLARGGRKIEVHVDFEPTLPITDVELFAERLASFAIQHQEREVMFVGSRLAPIPEVRYFTHTGKEYDNASWQNPQVFSTPYIDVERLTQVVAEKETLSAHYANCGELWLLLVVDFFDPAQDQALVLPTDFKLPSRAFSRLLVYKPQSGEVLEVPK